MWFGVWKRLIGCSSMSNSICYQCDTGTSETVSLYLSYGEEGKLQHLVSTAFPKIRSSEHSFFLMLIGLS